MYRRPPLALLSLALAGLLAACGDSGTDLPPVDRVRVTPEETALGTLGETVQFQAQALDAAGAPVNGLEYSWVSSNTGVATVDGTGRATAVSVGEAFIRATTGGVTGEGRLVVRECGAPVALAPGQWTTLDVPGQNDCGFILPAGGAGDRYRVALVRTGSEPDEFDVPTVSLQVRALSATSVAEPAPSAWSTQEAPQTWAPPLAVPPAALATAEATAQATARMHLALREREARMLDALGGQGLLPSRTGGALQTAARADAPDRILIDSTTPTFCSPAGTPAPAFKVAENDDLAIFQDSAQALTTPITASQAQRMLDYYSAYGKPIIQDYFGGVSDIDGNGKVLVVAHPVVEGGTAAFVWSGDLFAKSECAASNEAELVFMSANLIRALDDGVHQALETLVHEVKHVSSLYNSIARGNRLGQTAYHPGWIEEGVAEIAGNMSSRRGWAAVGGPAVTDMLVASHIVDFATETGGGLRPEFYGTFIRLFRTQGYLNSQPNGVVVNPQGSAAEHSIYGSGWVFWRFVGDAYGAAGSAPYADAPLFRQQNDSLSPAGVAGLQAVTGRSFPELMVEYAVAIMLNGTGAPAPARAYTGYNFPSAVEIWCFAADNPPCEGSPPGPAGTFPWPVTTLSTGVMSRPFVDATYSGKIGAAGLRIHEFSSTGGNDAEILVSAPTGTRVVVVRVQ